MGKQNNKTNHSNRKGDFKSNKGKGRKSEYRSEVTSDPGRNPNDVSWYANNPQLLVDSSSISYSWPIGAPLYMGETVNIATTVESIPGIMAIESVPVIGGSSTVGDGSSPINIAAKNLYSFVRHANSGHSNYDSPDLMMYLLAIDSIYCLIAHGIRAYGVARTYSQTNRYLPEAVLTALNFDFNSVQNNLANFRMRLNTLMQKVGSLVVPADMPLFKRHIWMYGNIFTDHSEVSKSQFYLYNLAGYYLFSFDGYETGTSLQYIPLNTDYWSWDEYCDMIDHAISVLVEDEDMNIMSGDILKAFDKQVMTWQYIDENMVILPFHSEEVLTQIQNVVTTGYPEIGEMGMIALADLTAPGVMHIHQTDTGIIQQKILVRGQTDMGIQSKLLNMPMLVPTPADTMVATRMMVVATDVMDLGSDYYCTTNFGYTGSEIAVELRIYGYTYTNAGKRQIYVAHAFSDTAFNSAWYEGDGPRNLEVVKTTPHLINLLGVISKFDWHPRLYLREVEWDDDFFLTDTKYVQSVGDVHTMAIVNAHDLAKMHTTAILSEFVVPQFGVFTK